MMTDKDIEDLLVLGQIIRGSRQPLVFTPEKPEQPKTRYERYLEYIKSITPLYDEFSADGWGGDDTPRLMAMKLHPYEEWDGI